MGVRLSISGHKALAKRAVPFLELFQRKRGVYAKFETEGRNLLFLVRPGSESSRAVPYSKNLNKRLHWMEFHQK